MDVFWERDLHPWDLAAGILLIREAGGFTSDCDSEAKPAANRQHRRRQRRPLAHLKKELAAAKKITDA